MSEYKTFGGYRLTNKSNVGTALTMLFVGLGIGAAVALLYAPQSGRQLRKSLRRGVEDAREKMEDWSEQANDLIERGTDWAHAAREKVAPIAQRLRRS